MRSLNFCIFGSRAENWAAANLAQAMHAGVIRDMEQQRIKKERQLDFEMQRALEKEYRKVQNVHDGRGENEKQI